MTILCFACSIIKLTIYWINSKSLDSFSWLSLFTSPCQSSWYFRNRCFSRSHIDSKTYSLSQICFLVFSNLFYNSLRASFYQQRKKKYIYMIISLFFFQNQVIYIYILLYLVLAGKSSWEYYLYTTKEKKNKNKTDKRKGKRIFKIDIYL